MQDEIQGEEEAEETVYNYLTELLHEINLDIDEDKFLRDEWVQVVALNKEPAFPSWWIDYCYPHTVAVEGEIEGSYRSEFNLCDPNFDSKFKERLNIHPNVQSKVINS